MTLLLSLVLGCNSWGQTPQMPIQIRKVLEQQIHKDLKARALRLQSRIEDTQIHFHEAVLLNGNERQLIYEVNFNELEGKGLRSEQQIRKKLLFDMSWRLLKIVPLDQEIRAMDGAEVSL